MKYFWIRLTPEFSKLMFHQEELTEWEPAGLDSEGKWWLLGDDVPLKPQYFEVGEEIRK